MEILVFDWINRFPIWIAISAAYDGIKFVYHYVCGGIYNQQSQIHEVIMFNELSYDCVFKHRQHEDDEVPFKCMNEYCSRRHVERIAEQLDRAQFSIDLAMYALNSFELVASLEAALKRGVKVRLIGHRISTHIDVEIKSLLALGMRMRFPDSIKLMHHKYCLIDGCDRVTNLLSERSKHYRPPRTTSVAICGSLNWTNGGFGANWENLIITSNTLINSELESEFNRMWREFRTRRKEKK